MVPFILGLVGAIAFGKAASMGVEALTAPTPTKPASLLNPTTTVAPVTVAKTNDIVAPGIVIVGDQTQHEAAPGVTIAGDATTAGATEGVTIIQTVLQDAAPRETGLVVYGGRA